MQVSRIDRESSVFLLKWEDVERLLELLSAQLPIITISASCADKLDRIFSGVTELKSFNNSKRAAITELKIVARSSDRNQRFSISFANEAKNNIRISLDSEEAIGVNVSNIYQDFLESIKPWYSFLAKVDWYYLVIFFFLLMQLLALAIALYEHFPKSFDWPKEGPPAGVSIKAFFMGFIPIFIGVLANKFKLKFFPMGVFAFGDGLNRYSRDETYRTVIIVSFLISCIASIVVAWF